MQVMIVFHIQIHREGIMHRKCKRLVAMLTVTDLTKVIFLFDISKHMYLPVESSSLLFLEGSELAAAAAAAAAAVGRGRR